MIPVFYEHIRIDDDIDRAGKGVYSRGERDHAQDFRGKLPSMLANTPGAEAQKILQRLAKEVNDPRLSKWLMALSEKQAAKSVAHAPWTPSEVAHFSQKYEKQPQTSDELFQIVLDRFAEIKNDVERGEFSERELLSLATKETCFQNWLAGRLRRLSRERYHVIREPELDRRKKPDIHLADSKGNVVNIEIKPVAKKRFKYTLKSLESTLEDQLVGQYMHDVHSRHGILVIFLVEKRIWCPKQCGAITFEELIEKLKEKSAEIIQKNSGVEMLEVFGIDCT